MELVELKEYIGILSGYAFNSKLFNDKKEGIPLIRIRDVGKNISKTFFSGDYDEKFIVNKGDFLIGMDGDFRLAEWKGDKALLNQRVCKLSMSDVSSNAFLYIFLSKPGVEEGILNAAQGSAQPNISAKEILMTSLLVPSKELIIEFSRIYQPFLEKIIAARKQSKELEKLRDTLLPKLSSGE